MFNWLKNLWNRIFNRATEVAEVLDVETREFIAEVKQALREDRTYFLVEVNVTNDTKRRDLKNNIRAAVEEKIQKLHPECSDIEVKSYYKRKN